MRSKCDIQAYQGDQWCIKQGYETGEELTAYVDELLFVDKATCIRSNMGGNETYLGMIKDIHEYGYGARDVNCRPTFDVIDNLYYLSCSIAARNTLDNCSNDILKTYNANYSLAQRAERNGTGMEDAKAFFANLTDEQKAILHKYEIFSDPLNRYIEDQIPEIKEFVREYEDFEDYEYVSEPDHLIEDLREDVKEKLLDLNGWLYQSVLYGDGDAYVALRHEDGSYRTDAEGRVMLVKQDIDPNLRISNEKMQERLKKHLGEDVYTYIQASIEFCSKAESPEIRAILENDRIMCFFDNRPMEEIYAEYRYLPMEELFTDSNLPTVVADWHTEPAPEDWLALGAKNLSYALAEPAKIDLLDDKSIDKKLRNFIRGTMQSHHIDAAIFNTWLSQGSQEEKLAIIGAIYNEATSYDAGRETMLEQIKNDLSPEEWAKYEAQTKEAYDLGMKMYEFSESDKSDSWEKVLSALSVLEEALSNSQYYVIDDFDTWAYDTFPWLNNESWQEQRNNIADESESVTINMATGTEAEPKEANSLKDALLDYIRNMPNYLFENFDKSDKWIEEFEQAYKVPEGTTDDELRSMAKEIWQKIINGELRRIDDHSNTKY